MGVLTIKDGFKGERSLRMPEMVLRIAAADPVLKNLYVADIGYYPHAAYHYRERVQPIDQNILIYCVKGRGKYRVGGRDYEVRANQFFILPALVPHAYASSDDEPWTIYWIHFGGLLADFYAEGAMTPQDVSASVSSRIADRNDIFEDIFSVLSEGYSLDNLRYTASLLHFYLGSLRYLPIYRRFHTKAAKQVDSESDVIISGALKYMEENVETQISLRQISEYAGYSPSHFSTLFRAATGHSPLSYFNLMKINHACELLDTTDMKVNQICCKVGIYDSYYFSRLFRKTVGISPRQYRESRRSL